MTFSRRSFLTAAGAAGAATLFSPSPAHARRRGMELQENFGNRPDGPTPGNIQTGQTAYDFAPFGGAGEPWVRNGFMSARYPQQFEGGCYRIAQLSGAAREIGARFALTPAVVGGGVLCLSIQMGNLAETHPSIPVSPLHFWLDANSWNLDVNTEAGTQVDYVASGGMRYPLAADGQTIHSVSLTLDRANNQVRIWLPDGQVVTVNDSRFNRGGRWVYVEPFKMPGGDSSTKSAALVREWWATS